jgi:hypothetical protein
VTTPNASTKTIVDSSGWIDYLGLGPRAARKRRHSRRQHSESPRALAPSRCPPNYSGTSHPIKRNAKSQSSI